MRPKGTPEELAQRRATAMRLLDAGLSYSETAEMVVAAKSSICRWNALHLGTAQAPSTPSRPVGRTCKLTPDQRLQLKQVLLLGAGQAGYEGDYWTLARIAEVIQQLFAVHYAPSAIWYLLERLDWSCQRPERRAYQRDEVAIARWCRYVFPQLKKRCAVWRETGFFRRKRLCPPAQSQAHVGTERPHAHRDGVPQARARECFGRVSHFTPGPSHGPARAPLPGAP